MQKKSFQATTLAWQKIALAFLGLLLSLVLLEAGLRLGGFVLSSIQEYGNLQSIKQKGAYRILCIGESTTQGEYPYLLEQVLNQRNIGVRFSVIDKGRGGKTTDTLLEEIESNLAEYHPDMVVTMMGANDGGSHMPPATLTTSGRTPFIRSLKIYFLARLLWLHWQAKAKEMGFYQPDEDRQSPGKAQTPAPKTELKETSDKSVSAEDLVKKTIELDPNDDKAYVELGRLYLEQPTKRRHAEDLFKKAIELNPKNDNAYVKLGEFYGFQSRPFQAEASFRKAIELNPKDDNAYKKLGELYRNNFRICPQAEAFFQRAIETNPENEKAYRVLGQVYRVQGKLPQAEAAFRKSIALSPQNDRHALGALLFIYEEMGKPELAKEYAEKTYRTRAWSHYLPHTINRYRNLKAILDRKRIKLVCVQYPMRDVGPLKKIFKKDKDVTFVDNEGIFKAAVKKAGFNKYFRDMFAGDFGHCTQKGNELLAQNIADVILREVFHQ